VSAAEYTDAETIDYRVVECVGAIPGSIGYEDHPDLRLSTRIEEALNAVAVDGFVLERIEQWKPVEGHERAMVIMRRPRP
jgi:hypothetical protein